MYNDEQIDLDLNNESGNEDGRSNKRLKDLSEKVRLASQERDELAEAKAKAEAETQAARKEVEFYSSFTDSTAKYPNAIEFKDAIKEKVLSGYTVEDATVSVLNKEGKLTPQMTPDFPAGGSATNSIKPEGEKPLSEMSRDEKLAQLQQAEARGDIALS